MLNPEGVVIRLVNRMNGDGMGLSPARYVLGSNNREVAESGRISRIVEVVVAKEFRLP